MGEHIAAQLEEVVVIAHREHGRSCEGYGGKGKGNRGVGFVKGLEG